MEEDDGRDHSRWTKSIIILLSDSPPLAKVPLLILNPYSRCRANKAYFGIELARPFSPFLLKQDL